MYLLTELRREDGTVVVRNTFLVTSRKQGWTAATPLDEIITDDGIKAIVGYTVEFNCRDLREKS